MSYVDPSTGDYALDQDGRLQRVPDSVEQEVYFRLTIHRGTYLDDVTLGSRLWELAARKSARTAAQEVPAIVREALQPMLDRGAIRNLTVEATPADRQLSIVIRLTDSGDAPYRWQLFQRVG